MRAARIFAPRGRQSGESSKKQKERKQEEKKGEKEGEGKAWQAKGEAREFYWL